MEHRQVSGCYLDTWPRLGSDRGASGNLIKTSIVNGVHFVPHTSKRQARANFQATKIIATHFHYPSMARFLAEFPSQQQLIELWGIRITTTGQPSICVKIQLRRPGEQSKSFLADHVPSPLYCTPIDPVQPL